MKAFVIAAAVQAEAEEPPKAHNASAPIAIAAHFNQGLSILACKLLSLIVLNFSYLVSKLSSIISTLYFGVFYTKKEGLKNEKASKRIFSSKYRYLNIY